MVERIEEALQARRRQEALSVATRSAAAAPPDISTIVYEKTRVVKVEPQTLRDNRVIAGFLDDSRADIYRRLRTQVLQQLGGSGHTTLAVTSPNVGEGKSLTAVNLAVSMAMDVNQTVLLVDVDLRRPSIHSYFGLQPEHGLGDYLLGEVDLSACLLNPGLKRLVLLPAVGSHPSSSEMLSSPKMASLARELRNRYPGRIVVYDFPPLLPTDDALVLLPHVESVLLVVQEGATRQEHVMSALDLVSGKLIGTVLNRASHA